MKVLVTNPPRFYEACGIFPATLPFPSRVGESSQFAPVATGTDTLFTIKKMKRNTFCLTSNTSNRARFGNEEEIAADCAHAWLHGKLPETDGKP